MNDFFSKDEVHDIPSTSNYFKFEEGDNQFRILGAFSEKTAIQGIEYWKTTEGKRAPVRLPRNADGSIPTVPISELEENKFGDLDMPKFFWAFPVWNYSEKKVQILEISQKTVLKSIRAYIENKKWGDPRDYDFIVNRGKEGEKTVYTVTVDPKEKIDSVIIDQYLSMDINIQALFEGQDPFTSSKGEDDQIADDAIQAGM